jgi:hypothetical protein
VLHARAFNNPTRPALAPPPVDEFFFELISGFEDSMSTPFKIPESFISNRRTAVAPGLTVHRHEVSLLTFLLEWHNLDRSVRGDSQSSAPEGSPQ